MLKLVEELKVVQERLAISFSIRGIFLDIGVVMAILGYGFVMDLYSYRVCFRGLVISCP